MMTIKVQVMLKKILKQVIIDLGKENQIDHFHLSTSISEGTSQIKTSNTCDTAPTSVPL
jgi:hypothetical protein